MAEFERHTVGIGRDRRRPRTRRRSPNAGKAAECDRNAHHDANHSRTNQCAAEPRGARISAIGASGHPSSPCVQLHPLLARERLEQLSVCRAPDLLLGAGPPRPATIAAAVAQQVLADDLPSPRTFRAVCSSSTTSSGWRRRRSPLKTWAARLSVEPRNGFGICRSAEPSCRLCSAMHRAGAAIGLPLISGTT